MSAPSQSKVEEFLSSYFYSCQYVEPTPYSSCQEVCSANSTPQPNLCSSNQSYKQQITSATFYQQPTYFYPTNDPSISRNFPKTNAIGPMLLPHCGAVNPSAPYPTHPTEALQERTFYNCTQTAPQYRDLNLSPPQWSDPTLSPHQWSDPTLSPHQWSDPTLSPHQWSDPTLSPHQWSNPTLSPDQWSDPTLSPDQWSDPTLSPHQWSDSILSIQQFLNPTLSNTEILNGLSKPPLQLPSTSGKVPKPPRTTNFRTSFSPSQLRSLQTRFAISSKIDRKDRMVLSQEIGVSETAIRTWFQNTRSKQKRKDAVVNLAKQAAATGTVARD